MRGAILGEGFGGDVRWIGEAARVVLPGLRVVGQGPDPAPGQIDLMASADGVWVGSPPPLTAGPRSRRLRGTAARSPPGAAPRQCVAAP